MCGEGLHRKRRVFGCAFKTKQVMYIASSSGHITVRRLELYRSESFLNPRPVSHSPSILGYFLCQTQRKYVYDCLVDDALSRC